MNNNDLIKGLKVHLEIGTDCDGCPFKDDILCFDKLVEATIKALEEKKNDV